MKWRIALALFLALAPTAGAAEEKAPEIALPEDPDAVVLSLDEVGGLMPPRKTEAPRLEIRADGTVRAAHPFRSAAVAKAKLEPPELRALLRFVVVEERFVAITEDAIRKEVADAEDGGLRPMPPDSSTTVIRIALKDGEHEVRQYAPAVVAKEHPKVGSLARLARVFERLSHLRATTLAGGGEAVARYVDLVNAAPEDEDAPRPRFVAGDLDDAWLLEDGGRKARFRRDLPKTEDGAAHGITATVVDPKGGEPGVSFHRW